MPTVRWSIVPMRCIGLRPSGTVLWSALLPASSKAVLTLTGSGLERSVRHVLPMRYTGPGGVLGVAR